MPNPARAYVDLLVQEAALVELCHVADRTLTPAWYGNADAMRSDTLKDRKLVTGNLYTTLNRLDLDAVREHRESSQVGRTKDEHVIRYCRVFFDFDPERPGGVSSTDLELQLAMERAMGLKQRLYHRGWPMPAVAMSGNGYHLQYRVALPNDAETSEQLKAIYQGLHAELSDDLVTFDRTVRNPARLCALYGTVKRKGPNLPERPHRRSAVDVPSDWRQVTHKQVDALASQYARMQPESAIQRPYSPPRGEDRGKGRVDYRALNIVALFRAHDRYIQHVEGNIHRVTCPWIAEHTTDPARGTIVFEADGSWAGFHCHHSHCAGRGIRDVVELWPDAENYC